MKKYILLLFLVLNSSTIAQADKMHTTSLNNDDSSVLYGDNLQEMIGALRFSF
ncbi:hypothetical protein [Photobacterium damselae]|uniref:hypothetical protein n=1 Tax=Photobacterium damselae TaxID=38293 RepID=UPI0012FD87AC|nr:hypothetical protein [Photobacterium damselae]